jgi:rhodanese-related sulfurtransferase
VFIDVNVPSKAFGELVESQRHTPSLPAQEVDRLIADKADVVVLDSRRFEEYRTMSIPTGTSVPGGELVLRLQDLAPRPETTVIVNCAGRTRSIIGTQSLINAGIPNKVFALRNGTIGWTLAGLELDRGAGRRFPRLSEAAHTTAVARAQALAQRAGVRAVDRATVEAWQRQPQDFSLFLLDVRNPEEFEAGHLPGFRSAPGGQLVQATDEWVGVRHARLVLADDDGVRATLAASWLIQMGWRDVHVLQGGIASDLETGPRPPRRPPLPTCAAELIAPQALAAMLDETLVIDFATSPRHAAGHVPGAWFVVRSRLSEAAQRLPTGRLVLTSCDGALAHYAAADLIDRTDRPVAVLDGGTKAWEAAGLPIERGLVHCDEEVDDVYKRPYEGTDNAAAAMQAYLDWEFGLIDQLARDGTHGFQVL